MRRRLAGFLLSSVLATAASAASILMNLEARTSLIGPPSTDEHTPSFTETSGLMTPAAYGVSSSGGVGSSSDNTTVLLGTLHSYSYSTFPVDTAASYTEGYVDTLNGSFSLAGSAAPVPSGASYAIEAVVCDNLLDLTNGRMAHAFLDPQSPAADVVSAPLAAGGGDQIDSAVDLNASTDPEGDNAQTEAFSSYIDTLNIFIDTGTNGVDFVSAAGNDSSLALAGTAEPGTMTLTSIGLLLAALALTGCGLVLVALPFARGRE